MNSRKNPSSITERGALTTQKKIVEERLAVFAQNVSVSYLGEPPVLRDVNLRLPTNEFIAVIGPNGGGKTTLFRLLMGLLPLQTGTIEIYGHPIKDPRSHQRVAYLPQYEEMDLDYPISVWDVVQGGRYGHMSSAPGLRRYFPPIWAGKEHGLIVEESLLAVDMLSHRRRLLGELSGGQKKRVFLARALAQKAHLLLLDEPLAGVDERSKEKLSQILVDLSQEGRTILMVTHDVEKVYSSTHRVVFIDGTVKDSGLPHEVLYRMNSLYTCKKGGREDGDGVAL